MLISDVEMRAKVSDPETSNALERGPKKSVFFPHKKRKKA